jgi:hypothetical protein
MRNWVLASAVAAAALGCGDNSRSCGDGTVEQAGFCVPAGGDAAITCGSGTTLDPATGTCEVDPGVCQNGTVLIDTMCVDPALGTVADLHEGPEPNGLGVIEASAARAGTVTLKAAGASFVLHGTIESQGSAPDVDTYVLAVDQPVLLRITADGVNSVDASFVVTSPDIPGWRRFAFATSAAKRHVFLPKSGTYYVSVADSGALFELADGGSATTGASGEYYVAVTQAEMPAATPVVASASATLPDGEVGFYSATIANGSHPITLEMPSSFAIASLVVTTSTFFSFDDEDSLPAKLTTSGLGTTLIVVDHVYDVSPSPLAFQLTIQ